MENMMVKIYSLDVLNLVFELEKYGRYPIEAKQYRHSDTPVVFLPEAFLLKYFGMDNDHNIPYNSNEYYLFEYDGNYFDPNEFDYGTVSSINISTTDKEKTLTQDQKLSVFEAYYNFLSRESQMKYEIDSTRDLVKDNPINKELYTNI